MKVLRKIIFFTFIICLSISQLFALEMPKHSNLSKTGGDGDPLVNRARAYLDKGKLKIAVENYGIFSGTANPQGLWGDFQYISNLSLVVGVPGKDKDGNPYPWAVGQKEWYNIRAQRFEPVGTDTTYWGPTVSESWFDRTPNLNRTDWESVEDAIYRLHNPLATAGEYYGSVGLYTNVEDQYPLIATSDIPETWPGSSEGRHWPGPWATDPDDSTGQTRLPGVFVSDQDIYFEFDDRLATRDVDPHQGYPTGIRATVSGFSYGTSIAEDIIFFRMYLHNESQYHYKNVYAGFYFDVDSYNRLANGSYAGRTNDDDMMAYNTDWNFGYIYDLDGDHDNYYVQDKKLAYSAVKLLETPVAEDTVDLDGDGIADIQPGDVLGLTSWHWFDWYFRPGARDVSPQGGPWSGDGQTPVAENKEEIQYKIIASDTSNLTPYDSTHYFHPYRDANGFGPLNPHFDSVEGLKYEYPKGLDCVFIMASGPFELAPGDSVPFSFCILMGEDEKDLVFNAEIAQLMYDHNYQGARAPKAPTVVAKEEDRKITLYWDSVSVHDTDILTGIQDFEGYRIYRSEDNGKTWGKKIIDEEAKTSYWEPIAQFDSSNGITGYGPLKPHRYLGDDTGLQFKYVDNSVENGRKYLYAVCAYDRGFVPNKAPWDPDSAGSRLGLDSIFVPSLENLLSNSPNLSHIVKVIPHRPPVDSDIKALVPERQPGTLGRGVFDIELLDYQELTGDDYELTFDCDYSNPPANTNIVSGSHTYNLVRLKNQNGNIIRDTLLENSRRYAVNDASNEHRPLFGGLRWGINIYNKFEAVKEDAYWTENSQCTYQLKIAKSLKRTRADYELRFIGDNADTVFSDRTWSTPKFTIPFQVWNTITNRKARLFSPLQSLKDSTFAPDVAYFVWENHLYENPDNDSYTKTFQLKLFWNTKDTVDDAGEIVKKDKDWAPGDVLVIPVRRPYDRGDKFIIHTSNIAKIKSVTRDSLKKVKVVPNPYIVHAGWEDDNFVRKLQFTNLPSNCKIHIFTVSGEKVITLYHNNPYDGSENWDLLTLNRQEAAPGLYVYVVEAANGQKYTGKFVVIK